MVSATAPRIGASTAITTVQAANIVETADSVGTFKTLLAAAEAAGLAGALSDTQNITVFAPTDDAFAAALDALGLTADELLADTETLTSILTYHVVPGDLTADYMEGFDLNHTTLTGRPLNVDGRSGLIRVGGVATETRPDLAAANGVVHVIDQALSPR